MAQSTRRPIFSFFGVAASLIGLLLLFSAFVAFDRTTPHKPIEVHVVNTAERMLNAARARAQGIPYQPPSTPSSKWPRILFIATPIMSLIAVVSGMIGRFRGEDRFLSSSAITSGFAVMSVFLFVFELLIMALMVVVGMALMLLLSFFT